METKELLEFVENKLKDFREEVIEKTENYTKTIQNITVMFDNFSSQIEKIERGMNEKLTLIDNKITDFLNEENKEKSSDGESEIKFDNKTLEEIDKMKAEIKSLQELRQML